MAKSAILAAILTGLLASPLAARDSLGVFSDWGAFRDPQVPLCYAIAAAEESRNARETDPYASIGTWPQRQVRGQVYFRLSRSAREGGPVRLTVGNAVFELEGSGSDAWATSRQSDAAIVAAMRAASRMSISATDNSGRRFSDRYSLDGAATALDAASVGCARSG